MNFFVFKSSEQERGHLVRGITYLKIKIDPVKERKVGDRDASCSEEYSNAFKMQANQKIQVLRNITVSSFIKRFNCT